MDIEEQELQKEAERIFKQQAKDNREKARQYVENVVHHLSQQMAVTVDKAVAGTLTLNWVRDIRIVLDSARAIARVAEKLNATTFVSRVDADPDLSSLRQRIRGKIIDAVLTGQESSILIQMKKWISNSMCQYTERNVFYQDTNNLKGDIGDMRMYNRHEPTVYLAETGPNFVAGLVQRGDISVEWFRGVPLALSPEQPDGSDNIWDSWATAFAFNYYLSQTFPNCTLQTCVWLWDFPQHALYMGISPYKGEIKTPCIFYLFGQWCVATPGGRVECFIRAIDAITIFIYRILKNHGGIIRDRLAPSLGFQISGIFN